MVEGSIWQQLAIGGTSVVPAVVLTHPIDTIKLRLQLQGNLKSTDIPKYNGMFSGLATIVREEGVQRLFVGISPALCRAFTFSSVRLGLYEPVRTFYTDVSGATEPTIVIKLAAGVTSGVFGALVGNPFELVKIRMQGNHHTYRHVFDGLVKVCREEGIRSLWNGTQAGIFRAAVFSASQLATYDHTKVALKRRAGLSDGIQLNFAASMTAGLITTTASAPPDYVKSILMHSKRRIGPLQVVRDVMKRDGGRSFFRGWSATYARLGPHTVITMMTLEAVRGLLGWQTL